MIDDMNWFELICMCVIARCSWTGEVYQRDDEVWVKWIVLLLLIIFVYTNYQTIFNDPEVVFANSSINEDSQHTFCFGNKIHVQL